MLPKALLFDFDGTLVDTEWAIYQAWLATFQKEGQDLPIETYAQCIGSDFNTWSPKTHLEDLTGKQFPWAEMDLERQKVIEGALKSEGPVPGAVEILTELEGQYVMAVVSSSSHDWVDGWLERLEMSQYFSATVCRGDAPRIKPAPDLYERASERIGIPPQECLVIEDSLNGGLAGLEAGMTVQVIPNRITKGSDFSRMNGVFESLTQWRKALGGICRPDITDQVG